jgi:hypothetical protein
LTLGDLIGVLGDFFASLGANLLLYHKSCKSTCNLSVPFMMPDKYIQLAS